MFSDYDPLDHRGSLSPEDSKQYLAELNELQKISDTFEHTHDEDKFWTMYNHASCLSIELVYFKECLNSCQAELEAEKTHARQLDASRIHGALIFASLSLAAFIAFVLPCPPSIAVAGIVGISVLSFVLWLVAFGIVQALYSHHPEMYEMHEKEDKTAFAAALATPVILAAAYQFIKFFAHK